MQTRKRYSDGLDHQCSWAQMAQQQHLAQVQTAPPAHQCDFRFGLFFRFRFANYFFVLVLQYFFVLVFVLVLPVIF